MDEHMETMQSEVDSAWGEDTVVETPDSAPETPADQPEVQEPDSAQDTLPAEQEPEGAPELFTLKNRDEQRQVTREEVVAMAQKGWDYDRVKEERDQLRQYRQEADPALELVKSYAQRNGMTVSDYLDYCRRQELIASGMSEQEAVQKVSMEKERADLDARRAEIEAQEQQRNSAAQAYRQAKEARQRDFTDFMRAYPKVKADEIPREVWESVRGGRNLTEAYTMYENRRLQTELAAERQNRKNQETSPGSLGGSNVDNQASMISQWWDETD